MSISPSTSAFVKELATNAVWQQELKALTPSSADDLNGWLASKGFTFTAEELKAELEAVAPGNGGELSDETLATINGGFYGLIYNLACKALGIEVESRGDSEPVIIM